MPIANIVSTPGSATSAPNAATIINQINALAQSSANTLTNPATANTVYAGPASGAAAAPGYRALVNADLPTPANQNANLVQAGPASGVAASPTYRALVAADIPLPGTYTAAAALTGTEIVGVEQGGAWVETTTQAIANLAPSGGAGATVQFQTVTVNTTMSATVNALLVDATAGALSITLPTAVGATYKLTVKRKDGSGNSLTINTTSSQTIDGATSAAITSQYSSLNFISDSANWWIT